MANLKKWINLSFLLCGVVFWTFFREIFDLLFSAIGFVRPEWVLAPADLAGITMGLLVFVLLVRSEKANTFLSNVLGEMAKITWPNGKETLISTGVVSVMVAFATFCILMFDTIWSWLAKAVLY